MINRCNAFFPDIVGLILVFYSYFISYTIKFFVGFLSLKLFYLFLIHYYHLNNSITKIQQNIHIPCIDHRITTYTIPEVTVLNKLKIYIIAGTLFVLALGTFSHFFYEWSNNNFIVGLFSPVNESIWEHMKLVFFPMLLYALAVIPRLNKSYPCIISAFSAGILLGTLLIPVIFYTYTGILGYHLPALDIGTFIFSVIISFLSVYWLASNCRMQKHTFLLCAVICFLAISFMIFTCCPPEIALFADPAASR